MWSVDVSLNKYLFFTEDEALVARLKTVFSSKQAVFRPSSQFPALEPGTRLVVIDGDVLPPSLSATKLKLFKKNNVPVVYIYTALSGKAVMKVLKSGVISVLFKDCSPNWIKRELRDILLNFKYLEKIKDTAANDNRTKKFLEVANSLTSDNDINKIMRDILDVMASVFFLKSTAFYIAKKGHLIQKIILGQNDQEYLQEQWELTDTGLKWLTELQQKKEPIYISTNSPKKYRRHFPANTLLLPLVIKDRFFGCIVAILEPDANSLTRNEIQLLKAFAEQTSVALENAKLYWDVIQAREELIRQEKRALMNQTIISLNHEINNPLSIISMEAQLLQQRLEKNENKIEIRFAKIEQNIERIKRILEKISALNVEDHIPAEYIAGKKMLNLYEN